MLQNNNKYCKQKILQPNHKLKYKIEHKES